MIDIQCMDGTSLETFVPVLISVMGAFRLSLSGNLASINSNSKSEYLLTCLALTRPRRISRAKLLEYIWPCSDTSLAGQTLNSLTYQLNKLASRALNGTNIIIHENGYYRLNTVDEVGVDIDYFDAWSERGKQLFSSDNATIGLTYIKQALALYRGDLCGAFSIHTVIERERLRTAVLDLLAYLADYYFTCKNYSKALHYIQRLIAYDACREDAHRRAMRCYVHLGQRAQALRQYRICCHALVTEFDAKPEPATINLFNQIRLDPTAI